MKRLLLILLLSMPVLASAGQGETPASKQQAQPAAPALPAGMKQYWLVLLKKGPKRDHSADEAQRLQAGHMANMQTYAERGILQIAGPMLDDGDLRGIFILDAPGRAGAEAMCNDDPAIQAGRLLCEIHPWMSQQGASLK